MLESDGGGGVPAGWYPDSTGRHQYRYWDGRRWRDDVADEGQTSVDRLSHSDEELAAISVEEGQWSRAVECGASAVDPLIAALRASSQDIQTRQAAAQALGQLGDPRAVDALLEAGEYHVVVAMGAVAVEPLIQSLRTNKRSGARKDAAKALGELGDPRAVDALIDAFDYFESPDGSRQGAPDVVGWAAWALGKIGDPRAVGPLAAVAQSGASHFLGWSVNDAVKAIWSILALHPGEVSEDALRDVVGLDNVFRQPQYFDPGGFGHEHEELRNYVDCSDIQRAAREELARRDL